MSIGKKIGKRIGKRKRKSTSFSEGKENASPEVKLEIIERPSSFDFNLGVNSAINRGFPVFKELLLSLKSPKVWNNPQFSCSLMPSSPVWCFVFISYIGFISSRMLTMQVDRWSPWWSDGTCWWREIGGRGTNSSSVFVTVFKAHQRLIARKRIEASPRGSALFVLICCLFVQVISDSFGSVDLAKCTGDVGADQAVDSNAVVSRQLFPADITRLAEDAGLTDNVSFFWYVSVFIVSDCLLCYICLILVLFAYSAGGSRCQGLLFPGCWGFGFGAAREWR
jgi:hypothetical protein